MSWDMLQRLIESDVFNQRPFLSVSYLSRYSDHVGIQHVLCSKLRQFPYEDIEFFLPELCHLIISVDNESMALEEFLLDLCEESGTAALLTFWLFQAYLRDLASGPHLQSFRTCQRVYNKVQHIVFGTADTVRHAKVTENVMPITVLTSFIMAGIGMPLLPKIAGPLAVAQAKKSSPVTDVIADSSSSSSPKVSRSQTVSGPGSNSQRPRRNREQNRNITIADPKASPQSSTKSPSVKSPPAKASRSANRRSVSGGDALGKSAPDNRRPAVVEARMSEVNMSSSSLPLPETAASPRMATTPPTPPVSAGLPNRPASNSITRRHSHRIKSLVTPAEMTPMQKTKLLRQNYFNCETAFLAALEGISNRLVSVPKPARLSALRAELILLARDLPAEVDIPVICPPSLVDGSAAKSRHHRIVKINPGESTVLNSAEKVPFLLMVEILRDDFSFDPESSDNQRLIGTLLAEQGSRKRIFDLTSDSQRIVPTERATESTSASKPDSVFEPMSGDLGSSPMLNAQNNDTSPSKDGGKSPVQPIRMPSSTTTTQSTAISDLNTPRTSATDTSGSNSPPWKKGTPNAPRMGSVDQTDFQALATHMRTASQMLAQLDATSGKRPRQEVAAIRSKIIASMQSLEEQSFDVDDGQGPTFDLIMAKSAAAEASERADLDEEVIEGATPDPNAGLARMENDAMTGGVQRKGDRDDPSAAVFGEAWDMKKERIRKTSPYGWMKNWDLVSVIVKTGADLRQEAFACQLIQVADNIFKDAEVPVWMKCMRMLVTGESSGLIETITNGVSLHSLKRSLTIASIDAGTNPKRRFATLKDHWLKTFGAADSSSYKAAVDAFKRSLAAYSMLSYILQLKDRHNGNLLIDNEGHIIHIDFGFMLSNSPGSVGFEAAPFKLTQEYVEVLGGVGSPDYEDWKKLCKQAFQALRRSADSIIDLVHMMGRDSNMPCYQSGPVQTVAALRQRFQLHLSEREAESFVETDLISKALGSYYTRLYDTFQYRTQGIY